jgi:hypothetical protein
MKCKMMTAAEAVDYLIGTKDKSIDFTFNDIDFDPEVEVSCWYGAKIINIFDEDPEGFFVMGYWGGGCTEGYDIYGCVDNSDDMGCVKDFMAEKLQNFMNIWCDSFEPCVKICVEIKED